MKLLSEFQLNEEGVILSVLGEGRLRRRLFDMGVTNGAKVKLTKVAPLGDPVLVEIRGYELSLRKKEADLVVMEENK